MLMKSRFLIFAVLALVMGLQQGLFAQLQDEKSVTITMDLQPILQLDMETADQIEFVFDDIKDYYAGITKYGATILKVSSTVSWDLYAVGRSNGTIGAEFWDQVIDYGSGTGTNAIDELPLSAVELHQSQPNGQPLVIEIRDACQSYLSWTSKIPFFGATISSGAGGLSALYIGFSVPAFRSPSTCGKMLSPSPTQTLVQWGAQSSGIMEGCIPPMMTGLSRARNLSPIS